MSDTQRKIYVRWVGIGGLLSIERFNSVEDAQKYIRTEVAPRMDVGDTVIIEED